MTNLSSSLAALIGDRNLWRSRADAAWGSSGVWNSGASWQASFNSEVALYNAEVTLYNNALATIAARDATIAARDATIAADAVALAAALSPASADTITGTVINSSYSTGAGPVELMRLTVDRTGYWTAAYYGNATGGGTSESAGVEIRFNGVSQGSHSAAISNNNAGFGISIQPPVLINNGQTISVWSSKTQSNLLTFTDQTLKATFVAQQSHPH